MVEGDVEVDVVTGDAVDFMEVMGLVVDITDNAVDITEAVKVIMADVEVDVEDMAMGMVIDPGRIFMAIQGIGEEDA